MKIVEGWDVKEDLQVRTAYRVVNGKTAYYSLPTDYAPLEDFIEKAEYAFAQLERQA